MPTEPPVCRRGEHFSSLNFEVAAIDQHGSDVPLPPGFETHATFAVPHQLDSRVEDIADRINKAPFELIREREMPAVGSSLFDWLVTFGHKAGNIIDTVYAVRYHQRQFFARLRIVTAQQSFAFRPPTGPTRLGIDDGPLRFELEAMVVRADAVLDALAKYAFFGWDKSPGNWTGLMKKLGKDATIPDTTRGELYRLQRRHDSWLQELSLLRNAIVHEGTFPGFEPLSHVRKEIHDVSVNGVPAGGFAIRLWLGLADFVPAFCLSAAAVSVPPAREEKAF